MSNLKVQNVEVLEAVNVENEFSWEVVEKPVFLGKEPIKGYKAILRNDNMDVLNVCKDSYTPTTNENFCSFVNEMSKVTGFEIMNFNEFDGGKKVLAFLKAPETKLKGYDFKNYLAVANGHDGTSSFLVTNVNEMVRCSNQFTAMQKHGMRALHTTNHRLQLEQITKSFDVFKKGQKLMYQNFKSLMSHKTNVERRNKFVKHILQISENVNLRSIKPDDISTRKFNQLESLQNCIEIEMTDLGKNDFALFSGVTRYTTHERNQAKKAFGNMFGTNNLLNQKALNFLNN